MCLHFSKVLVGLDQIMGHLSHVYKFMFLCSYICSYALSSYVAVRLYNCFTCKIV